MPRVILEILRILIQTILFTSASASLRAQPGIARRDAEGKRCAFVALWFGFLPCRPVHAVSGSLGNRFQTAF
jgi:hypothetical protein